jgi:hypothetical protein
VRGIPINLNGEDIHLVPIEAGPKGKAKREALWTLWDAQDRYKDAQDETQYEGLCNAVFRLAQAMLAENYPAEKVDEIAGSFPMGYADGLVNIALNARLPADFTMAEKEPGG